MMFYVEHLWKSCLFAGAARLFVLIHALQLMQRVALESDRFVFPPLLSIKKAQSLSPHFVAQEEVSHDPGNATG